MRAGGQTDRQTDGRADIEQTDGHTDMTKPIVTFRNFENALKTDKNIIEFWLAFLPQDDSTRNSLMSNSFRTPGVMDLNHFKVWKAKKILSFFLD
jgi:hypothetical protein